MRSQNSGQPLQLAGSLAAESVLCFDIWTGAVDVDYRNRLHSEQLVTALNGMRWSPEPVRLW
jgi:hypothetical protein